MRGEAFDRIFGGNTINIRPQGSAEVIFGINTSRTDNPRIPVDQRRITTFNFDQRIQLNLVGNIGEKLKIDTNYNTEATFDFENQVKLDYTGYEDEIIQKIEAGNVSLPLNGTLIQGSQSLFGLKTELRFGRLTATAIFSQEKGQRRNVQVSGGRADQHLRHQGGRLRGEQVLLPELLLPGPVRGRPAHAAHGEQRGADHPRGGLGDEHALRFPAEPEHHRLHRPG